MVKRVNNSFQNDGISYICQNRYVLHAHKATTPPKQPLMERRMDEINLRDCLIYLDDIIIILSNFKDYLEELHTVFSA